MTTDFTTTILVDETPEQVFNAITNVRGWWSAEIEGNTAKLNDEFHYHYQDVHTCDIQLSEVVLNKRMVWLVKHNYFKFTKDTSEWTGTTISFDIAEVAGKTQMVFTHHGLTPDYECFDICSNAWTTYIGQSLRSLITTGKGNPNSTAHPTTEDEKRLSQVDI